MQTSALDPSSQKLVQCLINLEHESTKAEAKMDLILVANELMPEGKPDFLPMVQYPKITELVVTMGKRQLLTVLTLMVKDFCSSLNVVRNMNEDQMIETAAMLLDECDNFRLQDYVVMFSMAKRGKFHPEVKILDRVDIQLISSIVEIYWRRRKHAGDLYQEQEFNDIEKLYSDAPRDQKLIGYNPDDAVMSLAGAIESLKAGLPKIQHISYDVAKEQLQPNPNYRNPYPEPPRQ